MRSLFNGLLASSCALAVVVTGCNERRLRPLTPCTTAGVSNSVPIEDVKNVDLLFMVDDSGSMSEEQEKLRAEFPNMIRALITGDTDLATPGNEWPAVESLRVAVVTSDMGVAGVGHVAGTTSVKISSCGGLDPERAHYGEDGSFRLQGHSVVSFGTTTVDCDQDNNGVDDSVTAAQLPDFLTFDMTANPSVDVDEYVRRVSCYTNTGTAGCAYEQQLESMLKAITPSDAATADALPGGRFYYQDDDGMDHSARGLGQGTDTNTTTEDNADVTANGGWLRDDSLIAVVMVTDEDDCSSKDRRVFNYNYMNGLDPNDPYIDQYGPYQSQTRCARHPELTFNATRYVEGLHNLRAGRENMLVFAAITGVPPDLTDDHTTSGHIEGTDNLADIVADPRMQYVYQDQWASAGSGGAYLWVPNARLRPACEHVAPGTSFTATGNATLDSATLTNVTVPSPITGTAFNVTATLTNGSSAFSITGVSGNSTIYPGMSVSGTGITPGTLIWYVEESRTTPGTFDAYLSAPATANGTGVTLSVGATTGPGKGMQVTSAGGEIDFATQITSVSGTGPYTVEIGLRALASGTAVNFTLGRLDVSATPAVRATAVAAGLNDVYKVPVTVQSICVDSFGPAMGEILRLIQSNLTGSCLPRALNRNAQNKVTCDVFVTLPPNVACDPALGYNPESQVPTSEPADTDGKLERCRVTQAPTTSAGDGGVLGGVEGWYYDDFSSEVNKCGSLHQRISFTTNAKPPRGSVMRFGCIQPVQDGNLAIDINAACVPDATTQQIQPDDVCPFGTEAAYSEFRLRYNMAPRGWGDTIPATDSRLQLRCEPNTLTCQIPCETDANCPGGFVCYNPRDYAPATDTTTVSYSYCANPTCGSGF